MAHYSDENPVTELPYMARPCGGKVRCPFRTDCRAGWLGAERAAEINESDSFTCHKHPEQKQCAGHMLVNRSLAYRLARSFGMALPTGDALVFDSAQQMVAHHTRD